MIFFYTEVFSQNADDFVGTTLFQSWNGTVERHVTEHRYVDLLATQSQNSTQTINHEIELWNVNVTVESDTKVQFYC